MTFLQKFFALGAVLVVSASVASATPITGSLAVAGVGPSPSFTLVYANGTSDPATGVDFTGTQVIGLATGTLAGFNGADATIESFSFDPSVISTTLYVSTASGVDLSFVVDTFILDTDNTADTAMHGTGILSETGYSSTEYAWSFSTTSAGLESFGLTSTGIAATPEPNSLMLLGTGLVSAAGMLFRRRSVNV